MRNERLMQCKRSIIGSLQTEKSASSGDKKCIYDFTMNARMPDIHPPIARGTDRSM
ncbi:MAG: hypothetical protein LKH27_05340 [Prevotella sp.]|jgi:hypothetical protein|nr:MULTISPECIES: hypothetical protein [unclassified Prevotella]MCH3970492.1 hypothetical protein [Prevotella sp.]MCH3992930.1 hypothetical protein [Prevotella sp.]MCH4018140.1 hypothetical protein [Prevotella sp.]MCH4186872.1 hypothetical protein [Prevotella sp.]MCH4215308.1 hypothetical protein [Prevotella sp.]